MPTPLPLTPAVIATELFGATAGDEHCGVPCAGDC
jgi:hypothetical protein